MRESDPEASHSSRFQAAPRPGSKRPPLKDVARPRHLGNQRRIAIAVTALPRVGTTVRAEGEDDQGSGRGRPGSRGRSSSVRMRSVSASGENGLGRKDTPGSSTPWCTIVSSV